MLSIELLALVLLGAMLSWIGSWAFTRYQRSVILKKIPSFIPAKDGCSSLHRWVEVPLTHQNFEGDQLGGGLTKVCLMCGFLGDGTERMVNPPGLERVVEFVKQDEYNRTLNKEVERRLQFDSGIYFDAWWVKHSPILKDLLNDSSKVEEIHTLLHNFLVRGSLAMQDLQDKIVKEIVVERKRQGGGLEPGLTDGAIKGQ